MPSYTQEREIFGKKAFPPPVPHRMENLRGPGFSNVVLKGFVLAGPYPGSSGTEIVRSLAPILRSGVTTFVNLQQELPKPGSGVAFQRSTYAMTNVVTAKNYLPEAQAIVDAGGYPQSGDSRPLSFVHLPIPQSNGATVPDETLKAFVLDLLCYIKAGEYLYLQCGDGNGRTGTVAAVLMGLVLGLSSSEALDLAQRSRKDRAGAYGLSPETHEQKMQVHRLLTDEAFRAAAAATQARHSNSAVTDEADRLASTLRKVCGILSKKGSVSLIYLRRYATALAGTQGGSGQEALLSRPEFDKLHHDADWFLTPEEANGLWHAAAGGDTAACHVSVAALLKTLRGSIPPKRAVVVHEAFRHLSGGTGFVALDHLASMFHAETHPDVRATRRAPADVTSEFYDTFGVGQRGEAAQRQVSAAEFEEYYGSISAAVNDDGYFDLLVRGCWPAPGARGPRPGTKPPISTTGQPAAQPVSLLHGALAEATAARSTVVHKTESGYAYIDLTDPSTALPALRAYATKRGDFTIALLGCTLRRYDMDRDGAVDYMELKHALAAAGCPLPDGDVELLFRALAAQLLGVRWADVDMDRTKLPVEGMHALMRLPLTAARRAVVLSAFNGLDHEGQGAIPVSTLLQAFVAEHHPGVAAGRVEVSDVYRAFQDAFGEAFHLIDSNGASLRAANPGSAALRNPALRTYYGVGDGLVRLPFFEAFHEGVSACVPEDAAFSLLVFHAWSGAGSRKGKAQFNPSALAAKSADHEDGILSSMARLGSSGASGKAGPRQGAPAVASPHPTRHSAAVAVAGSAYSNGGGGGSPSNAADGDVYARVASKPVSSPAPPHAWHEGDGTTGFGSRAVITAKSPSRGRVVAPTGDAELDAALAVVRGVLLKRGMKSLFRLIRAFEGSLTAITHVSNLHVPLPTAAFTAVVRDASLGLSAAQLDALTSRLDTAHLDAVAPMAFVDLIRGPMPASRVDVIRQVYAHIVKHAGAGREPTIDEIRMLYRSTYHPDVTSGKRSEEEALREFLETFDGATFVGERGEVSAEAFHEYYSTLSFFIPEDAHFTVLLFATWALFAEGSVGGGSAAGKPSASAPLSTPSSLDNRAPRTALAANALKPEDWAIPSNKRGYGLERLGYGPSW